MARLGRENEELAYRLDEVLSDPTKLVPVVNTVINNQMFIKIICMLISDAYKDEQEDVARGINQLRWDIEDRVLHEIKAGLL